MKLVHSIMIKSGGGWIVSRSADMEAPAEFRDVFTLLGYRELDNGDWFRRIAHDECEVIKVE